MTTAPDPRFERQRAKHGFLDAAGLAGLVARGNCVFDPGSILISRHCVIGSGNLFYPGTVIQAGKGGEISIGDRNIFWPGATLVADAGAIVIGDANHLGPGGFSAVLDGGGRIEVGSRGRYRDGAALQDGCVLGDGCQVLGAIQVQHCRLGGGGAYGDPDPALRGGVLKGCGRARGLVLGRGEVILGEGRFDRADIVEQTRFHPGAASQA